MKNSVRFLLLALYSSAAMGATFKNTDVADGEEVTLAVTDDYNKVVPSNSAFNQYLFEKDGTLKLTGSGAEATLNVLIFATNGTVTVDLSGFGFDDEDSKVLNLIAGAYCGETGALKITGANDIRVGNTKSDSTAVNFSSLTLDPCRALRTTSTARSRLASRRGPSPSVRTRVPSTMRLT